MFSRRAGYAALACLWAGLLTGCVENTAASPPQAEARQASPGQPGASPSRASVALVSVTGVSETVGDQFKSAFVQNAVQHQIAITESASADYLVRGYLNPHPTPTGTAIELVFDIFDSKKRRAQRLDETIVVQGAAGSPSLLDENAIRQVAAKSAAAIANFLATAPEAAGDRGRGPDSTTSSAARGSNDTQAALR